MNYSTIGIPIFILGLALNTLVVLANKGLMPVDIEVFKRLNCFNDLTARAKLDKICQITRKHVLMTESTRFKVLGDRYTNTLVFGYGSIGSIGDVLLSAGSILIFYQFLVLLYFMFLN